MKPSDTRTLTALLKSDLYKLNDDQFSTLLTLLTTKLTEVSNYEKGLAAYPVSATTHTAGQLGNQAIAPGLPDADLPFITGLKATIEYHRSNVREAKALPDGNARIQTSKTIDYLELFLQACEAKP